MTQEFIKSIRPGYGIAPKYLNNILGKTLIRDVKKGDSVQFEMFQG